MSHMRVSKYVEKAFQLAFLKLRRSRKGVGVGVTAALTRMAIGWCWVCGIGSSTALLLSDVMLLLTKERSGLCPRVNWLLLNEQGSSGCSVGPCVISCQMFVKSEFPLDSALVCDSDKKKPGWHFFRNL